MSDLKPIIEQSFSQYSAAVIQSRALVDARDGLKPSARQIFYSMLQHKLTHDKPYKKTANAVGMAMADYYIHGDSSCEGIIMRAGQGFSMRYPLVDVKGNAGSLIESGNWAAMRYTESRLSKMASILFDDIDKETIDEWRDNYDNTKQYPAVLPSKGFYNICNGTMGIAVGLSSSIPQYNVRELNAALIHLIDNPDCAFEDIYCAPDFATGAILYNEKDVKESMKNGNGLACKLRSVVEFDSKERCFVVTEVPYGVYTNTICSQLEEIINGDENPGIERFNDLTGEKPLIKIYLSKRANPDKVLKYLYKETSLQHHYGINFTMLDEGRFPKVFTWKEMLQAHINHERKVYRRGFEFDLKKIEDRMHIIEGLLICMAHIDEVVATIKASASTAAAATKLQENFLLDAVQAKAVLDMKLSRLAHLEVKKLEDEYASLKEKETHIKSILEDEELFKEELKKGWREVADKLGDARRTKIMHLGENDFNEPIEEKQLSVSFTNGKSLYVTETSSLYAQKRNGVGNKFKLDKDEYIVDNLTCSTIDTIMVFTDCGNFYHFQANQMSIGEKQYLGTLCPLKDHEKVVAAAVASKKDAKPYIIFITKNGILKKSALSEYNLKRNAGAIAIKLDEGDKIVSILFTNEENIGIASKNGNFIIIHTDDIRAIGRSSRGIVGIKLNDGDNAVSAQIITPETTEIASVSTDGYIKRSPISEFKITGRATKGVKIQGTESLCDFLPLNNMDDILVSSSTAQIRLKLSDVPVLGRGAQGVKAIKLAQNSKIMKLASI